MFLKLLNFLRFARDFGFRFAVRYKLGLAKEGIDFVNGDLIDD